MRLITDRNVKAAYLANVQRVRDLFAGFFSPGLIDRLCCDLYDGAAVAMIPYLETDLARRCLARTLRGELVGYNPHRDPELETATVRERERTAAW